MSAAAPLPSRPAGLRAVAVDMDGTFLDARSGYDRARFAPLRERMRQEGVRFVVASGNQEAQLEAYFSGQEQGVVLAPDGVVSDNGAIVAAGGQRLLETAIDPEPLARALSVLDDADGLSFVASGPDGALLRDCEPEAMKELLAFYHPRHRVVPGVEDIASARVSKIALIDLDGIDPALLGRLSATLGGSLVPVASGHMGTDVTSIADIIVPGRHKASGLEVLVDHWGLSPSQVAAFGDSGNDVEMLAWAGTGVAMADASPAAVAVADARAPSNEAGGVLSTLEAWFPGA